MRLEKVQSNSIGNYSVFITNSVGAILSSNAALTLLPPPVCAPSPPNLVSWWPADGFASDVIGTNNPTVLSDIFYQTGKVGRAFTFNGVNSRITIPNSPSLNFGSNTDFSIEGWVKVQPPAFSQRPSFDNVPLFEKRSLPAGIVGNSGYSLSLYRGRLAFWLGPTVVIPPAGPLARCSLLPVQICATACSTMSPFP